MLKETSFCGKAIVAYVMKHNQSLISL